MLCSGTALTHLYTYLYKYVYIPAPNVVSLLCTLSLQREASGADVDGGPTSSLTNEDLSKKYGISAEDILAFKAQEFVLGKIPICPPPPELC